MKKVNKYRYSLDQDSKSREDIGLYEAPCTTPTEVKIRPTAQESNSALRVS